MYEKKRSIPIIGYTGHFLGKVDGIIGRPCSRGDIAISEREYRGDDLEVYKTTSNLSFIKFGITTTTTTTTTNSSSKLTDTTLSNENCSNYSSSPEKKKYMTGYTGGSRFKNDPEPKPTRNLMRPILGYNGDYKGKINGNLGRAEVHIAHLSSYDQDVVNNILGNNNFIRRIIILKKI